MSFALYSIKSKEATKLKDNGYEISIGDNDDGTDTQINITREDGNDVKFNNIYTKTEIDSIQLGKTTLEGFYKLNVYPGGSIPLLQANGTLISKYATSLETLYKILKESQNNLSNILAKLNTDTLLPDGHLSIITDQILDENDIADRERKETTTFAELITALQINNGNIEKIINRLFQMINDISEFTVDEFNNASLITDGTQITSIEYNNEKMLYEEIKYNITKYPDLINALKNLTLNLSEVISVNANNDLEYINESTNQTWEKTKYHISTLNELITYLNSNNLAIYNWLVHLESIETDGIDTANFANTNINLNDINVIEMDSNISLTPITNLNDLITKLNTTHNNINDLMKKSLLDGFATKNIYPEGKLKTFGNTLSENLNEVSVKTYENLFTSLNNNYINLNSILNNFNSHDDNLYETVFNMLNDMECLMIIKTDGKLTVKRCNIKINDNNTNLPIIGDGNIAYEIVSENELENIKQGIQKVEPLNNDNPVDININKNDLKDKKTFNEKYGPLLMNITMAIMYFPCQAYSKLVDKCVDGLRVLFNYSYYLFENRKELWIGCIENGNQLLVKIEKYFSTENVPIDNELEDVDYLLPSTIKDTHSENGPSKITKYYTDFKTFWGHYWNKIKDKFMSINWKPSFNWKGYFNWISDFDYNEFLPLLPFILQISLIGYYIYRNIRDENNRFQRIQRNTPATLLEDDMDINFNGTTIHLDADIYNSFESQNYIVEMINSLCEAHNIVMDNISKNQFTSIIGFPDFYVKNKDIEQIPLEVGETTYNKLLIKVPELIKNRILAINTYKEIFKIILRKEVVYDSEGKYTKEFLIFMQEGKIHCPIITYDEENDYCVFTHSNEISTYAIAPDVIEDKDNDIFIAFDKTLPFNPKTLYNNGEMSIMYLLSQDSLKAPKPVIKCDIIEAENALKLHKSDVHYFYKPSIITQQAEGEYDYYKMVFEIPESYTIPDNLMFKFKEYCFGNEWALEWDGLKWNGKNCEGRVNSKVINKVNMPCEIMHAGIYNIRSVYGAWIMIKDSDWNKKFLPEHKKGLGHSLWDNTTKKFKFLMKDGTVKNCEDYYKGTVKLSEVVTDTKPNYPGYSCLPIKCIFDDERPSTCNNMKKIQEAIEKLYVEFYVPNQAKGVRLIFKTNSSAENSITIGFGTVMNIVAEYDTIDKLAYEWEDEIPNTSRDVVLYLRKDLADPIEEINWDSSTNAFDYIIKQQFYEITQTQTQQQPFIQIII